MLLFIIYIYPIPQPSHSTFHSPHPTIQPLAHNYRSAAPHIAHPGPNVFSQAILEKHMLSMPVALRRTVAPTVDLEYGDINLWHEDYHTESLIDRSRRDTQLLKTFACTRAERRF